MNLQKQKAKVMDFFYDFFNPESFIGEKINAFIVKAMRYMVYGLIITFIIHFLNS